MKNLSRLTVLVVILAALTLATGIAFARESESLLGIDLRGNGTPEDNASSTSTAGIDLRGDGTPEDNVFVSASASSASSGSQDELELVGVVQSLTSDSIVILDTLIAITSATEIKDALALGDTVKVHAYTTGDGTLTAREIELYDGSHEMEDSSEDESGDDKSSSSGESEPDDDKGGSSTQTEPGDDKGGSSAQPEPGDDKGGSSTQSEPGDDKGGSSGSDD